MNLNNLIQKANLSNVMIIVGLIVGSVTAYNTIDDNKTMISVARGEVAALEQKIVDVEKTQIEHKLKISSLESNNEKFDATLQTVNNTLLELNGTIKGLQATVETMQK
ncbi:hypothetical protein KGV31_002180 [Vibrio parahaemolyticus]|nr:hypothetical protein [Vibrio parahaemolyticus]EHU0344323.1 hypothetical protein [Vibrio parahaemolyticus]EHU0354357.1 hypothetical protein [Vibrio parahaemolyticus]